MEREINKELWVVIVIHLYKEEPQIFPFHIVYLKSKVSLSKNGKEKKEKYQKAKRVHELV